MYAVLIDIITITSKPQVSNTGLRVQRRLAAHLGIKIKLSELEGDWITNFKVKSRSLRGHLKESVNERGR